MLRFTTILLLILIYGLPKAYALDGCTVPNGATYSIDEHGQCRDVENNTGLDIFVPTKTAAEWSTGGNSFLGATPTNISLSTCKAAFTISCTPLPFTIVYNSNIRFPGNQVQIDIDARGSIPYDLYWKDSAGNTGALTGLGDGLRTVPITTPGIVTLSAVGDLTYIGGRDDNDGVIDVVAWHDHEWARISFKGEENLTGFSASDVPDTSSVTDMSDTFDDARNFNHPLNTWDVSSVIDMEDMFRNAEVFNQNISAWDVSSVVDMNGMFRDADTFNQNLSGWCVSNIPFEQSNFDSSADSWVLPRPVWGTCP